MRVAMLASECEPWAKTGGLADVVDALARALGELGGADLETPVDVFLPRYRGVPEPDARRADASTLRVPDPRAPSGSSRSPSIDVAGKRLPVAPRRPSGRLRPRRVLRRCRRATTPTTPWRFGLFCRAALEALRADGRPLDVLHLHDWHTGPAAIYRDDRYADDPIVGGAAILMTLHNLAYHGWTPRGALCAARTGARATAWSRPTPTASTSC